MASKEPSLLRISAKRAGGVEEIARFLTDLNAAYEACYLFDNRLRAARRRHYFEPPFYLGLDADISFSRESSGSILPDFQLELTKVSINSPGFWEFAGALNPLHQIREYLKDRHERLKDRDYRNESEKERLKLENELLQTQIFETQNRVLRERVLLLRETGVTDQEISEVIWRSVGKPLAQLGQHQDTGLIGKPLISKAEEK